MLTSEIVLPKYFSINYLEVKLYDLDILISLLEDIYMLTFKKFNVKNVISDLNILYPESI